MLSPENLSLGVLEERARSLAREVGLSPVVAQLLLNRGVDGPEAARRWLEADLSATHDPFLFRDMERAVDLVVRALQAGTPILVHGDYDVDGVCSTVILVETLALLGADVRYHVPHRETEGYGVSEAAVEAAADRGAGLLVTADCGSSSHRALQRARERGMRVVVTDHHRIPADPPAPDAFLNPGVEGCSYPYKGLCGAGMAWKLACALHRRHSMDPPLHLLDLVALATIADVVPLTGENRALVRVGLEVLSRNRRPGLAALAAVAGVEGEVRSGDVAFCLAPRLNAAGRLDSARLAVELLLEEDPEVARQRALHLEELNERRRTLEREIRQAIEERLREHPERLDRGVVVEAGEGWHPGVIGIAAARVADAHRLPAFVLAVEGETARGSARSPGNVDLYEAMQRCAEVFVRFGGHSRAAGFTVETARLAELRDRLADAVAAVRRGPPPPLRVDLELDLPEVRLDLVRELERLEPFGEGNPPPRFLARRVRLECPRAVGGSGEHLSLWACRGPARIKAIAFRQAGLLDRLAPGELCYDLVVRLEEDDWEGTRSPSLLIEQVVAPEPTLVEVLQGRAPAAGSRFVDGSCVLDREKYLRRLQAKERDLLVVVATPGQAERVRQRLEGMRVVTAGELVRAVPSRELVLLAPPPAMDALESRPFRMARRIHLLFGERELAREESRCRTLALDRARMEQVWRALVRRSRGGWLADEELPQVAGELAPEATLETVRAALGVLEELGVVHRVEGRYRLGRGQGRRLEESKRYRELKRLQGEFQRVRRFFSRSRMRLQDRGA